jgi:Uncharacterized protein conserved in bacteria
MKHSRILIWAFALTLATACNTNNNVEEVNSLSFPENNVVLNESLLQQLASENDSTGNRHNEQMDRLVNTIDAFEKNPTPERWSAVLNDWTTIGKNRFANSDTVNFKAEIRQWADINIRLLKMTEDVSFGDELEKLLYSKKQASLTGQQVKSVIYSHLDDKIFVNLLGSSSVTHHHTTGGSLTLIQQTSFPESNEMTLSVETGDVRFLDVFIRIPSWAQNPTAQLGNVKFVANPGEYCEISRKWKNGDQIHISLKN